MTVILDTSGLFALADSDDSAHTSVVECVQTLTDSLIIPITVLPEFDYLLGLRLGARAALTGIRAAVGGDFQVASLASDDLMRTVEVMERYLDNPIGFVDASIVAIAERLGVTRVLTLDRRHFRAIRPRHCPAFELLPELA